MGEYLDFDEAVSFLKTNPSTLYKWLQNGRIPGHKLGRQWRFLRYELEAHIAGRLIPADYRAEIAAVSAAIGVPLPESEQRTDALARALFWHNFDKGDHGYGVLHFQPNAESCRIIHKTKSAPREIARISHGLFAAIDDSVQKNFQPGRDENSRRIFLSRADGTAMETRYQRIDTAAGPYATARSHARPVRLPTIDEIAPQPAQRQLFLDWLAQPQGIILVTGGFGSGKTTTLYTLLEQAARDGRTVFTLEDDAPYMTAGVNQVELAARNLPAFERQFGQIFALGAEVIGVVIGSFAGLEPVLFAEAAHAAREGRLVIIQTTASTAEAGLAQLRRHLHEQDEGMFIGVVSQVLVPKEKGRMAEYTFLRG